MALYIGWICCVLIFLTYCPVNGRPTVNKDETDYSRDLGEAELFLRDFDARATQIARASAEASWAYATDLTPENMKKTVDASFEESEFFLQESRGADKLRILDLPSGIQRQITLIRRNADSNSGKFRRQVKELEGNMTALFGKAKVCLKKSSGNKCLKKLSLEPDLTDIMKKSRDPNKLMFAWLEWRNAVGPSIKPYYEKMIDLLNIGAREHGWIDYGDFLRSDYEMGDDFEISLKRVWDTIEPLYQELHAYVRFHLRKLYRSVNISETGTIPAHLLGDMWAQNWENVFDLVKPFPKAPALDITSVLKKNNTTPLNIFKLSESFFLSLGLYPMPKSFWEKSVIEKPKDKEMVCHASAWDFSENSDVRIKMCTEINQKSFITVHHEMGHIEYFLAYKNQPFAFRSGANPGFHEAIGDTIALSVETPSYLTKVGLLDSFKESQENTISFLLHQALKRIAPIPYNYLVDKWRWRVYEGNITAEEYNSEWWRLRTAYQGVSSPVSRNLTDFDPASKYHISANVPYIAYFVSYVLQFQFHRALCKPGHSGPLHKCSIYGSKEAGQKFKEMLEAGRSKPWPKILKTMTGERDLSASAIMEYFQPLYKWLQAYREEHNYPKGWSQQNPTKTVLQREEGKSEPGQERSGILKTNNGGIQLSINIPTITFGDGSSNSKSPGGPLQPGESRDMSNSTNNGSVLDLAKLIGSGNPVSITSTETSAFNKDGSTEVANKEVSINTGGPSSQSRDNVDNSTRLDNSTSGLNGTSLNGTAPEIAGLVGGTEHDLSNTNFNATAVNTNLTAHEQQQPQQQQQQPEQQQQPQQQQQPEQQQAPQEPLQPPQNPQPPPPPQEQAQIQQQQPPPQQQPQVGNGGLSNETINGLKNINITAPNMTEGNSTTTQNGANGTAPVALPQGAPVEAVAQARSCRGSKRSPGSTSSSECSENEGVGSKALQISPAELVQHLLLNKVKNVVQDSVPQARVEKTANGFTVNLDLNAKDKIPAKSTGYSGRQQHVNVYIAPKGVVVKPKSSVQLMKPSFVPVQNKDNLELRDG